jgi:hypothetical protein
LQPTVAFYRPDTGAWLATLSGGGTKRFDGLGLTTDVPIQERPGIVLPPPPAHEYFGTLPVGSALPRGDADCANRVTRNPWEPRPENNTANHTVPSGTVPWNNNPSWTYWSAFIALRNKVTGNFTGTTGEIIQWAACKWGIDEDLIRAEPPQHEALDRLGLPRQVARASRRARRAPRATPWRRVSARA